MMDITILLSTKILLTIIIIVKMIIIKIMEIKLMVMRMIVTTISDVGMDITTSSTKDMAMKTIDRQ